MGFVDNEKISQPLSLKLLCGFVMGSGTTDVAGSHQTTTAAWPE